MTGNSRKCPFGCGGTMVPLRGGDGPQLLFDDMVDSRSMGGMLSGALNRRPRTRYEQCDNSECGFLALFPPVKLRR
jgi:hypothetical protein